MHSSGVQSNALRSDETPPVSSGVSSVDAVCPAPYQMLAGMLCFAVCQNNEDKEEELLPFSYCFVILV